MKMFVGSCALVVATFSLIVAVPVDLRKVNGELVVALGKFDLEGVKNAVQAGAQINRSIIDGKTPLMVAVMQGAKGLGIVQYLVTVNGIDLKVKDSKGRSAKDYAIIAKNKDAVSLIESYL